MKDTESVITFLEQHKETLHNSEMDNYMRELHRGIRTMPPHEWKRVQSLQEYIRNKANHLHDSQ